MSAVRARWRSQDGGARGQDRGDGRKAGGRPPQPAKRYIEFLELMDRAKANGARLDKQIVTIFNTWGYPNARGGVWKINNYSRVKRKALAAKLNYSPEPELPTSCFEPTKCKIVLTHAEKTVEADVPTEIDDDGWDELIAELAAATFREERDPTEYTLEEIEQIHAELDNLLASD
jgi:hypothetical protein